MQPNISFSQEDLQSRILLGDQDSNGQPSIRNKEFTVSQILEFLLAGMTMDDIVSDYPALEREDVMAALFYASNIITSDVAVPVE